jgi:glycosyltransferase involved in cell wall biosynthesis
MDVGHRAERLVTESPISRESVRVAFVSHRFPHHASHSGYDRLLEGLSGEAIDGSALERLTRVIPDRVFTAIRDASGMRFYGRARFLHEARAALPFLLGAKRVFFFPYGENGCRFLSALPNMHDHRIAATYHRPASVLPEIIANPTFLAHLDQVVILGESQRAFFRQHLDNDRITCIPHPVDTEFFSPAGADARQPMALFVGHYLRDFECLRAAVPLLIQESPDLRIMAVTRPRFRSMLEGLPNTEVLANVSDTELRTLYRTARVLLLPLLDGVGNNTILEALACGLPVVTTDVGSVAEYLNEASAILVPRGDAARLAEGTLRLLADPALLLRASTAGRKLAIDRFDLAKIRPKLAALLEEVARRPKRRG